MSNPTAPAATQWTARRSLHTVGLLACAALLSACGKPADPATAPAEAAASAPAAAAPAPRAVDQLFTPEAIGMNLAYVEKIAGPAVRSDDHRHLYRVDGCELTLRTDDADKAVQVVEVAVTPSCQLSLEPLISTFAGTPPLQLDTLTMGSFHDKLGGAYYADCLSMCGNAADPVVSLVVEGPRALQLMEFALEVPLVDGPALDAAEQWRSAMQQAESEDYVLDGRFNCEPQRFQSVVAPGFAAVKPARFIFGHGLAFESGECD